MAKMQSAVAAICESARAAGLSGEDIIDAIVVQCAVSRLRAHRMARGWTLQDVVAKIKSQAGQEAGALGHTRVSRWETGERPTPRYLDALCRLYETRPDLLGYGVSYSPTTGNTGKTQITATRSAAADNERDEDGMRRRNLLQGIALGATGRLSQEALEAVEQTQEMLQRALSPVNSVNRATVEYWQDQVVRHAVRYRSIPAVAQMKSALVEFDSLCKLLQQRQSPAHQVALTSSAARMAGLIGILLVDIGQPQASRSWFRSGFRAANEVDNRYLAAWLTSREALTCLYYEGPQSAIELARRAQALTRGDRSVASTLAPAVEARALSQVGHVREAIELMKISEQRFATIDDAAPTDGALGFSRQKLLFYKGNVMARSGRPSEALAACRAALRMYPEHDVVDRAHIHLDEALVQLRLGEAKASADTAAEVLTGLPESAGKAAVVAQTKELVQLMRKAGAVSPARSVAEAVLAKQAHVGV